MENKKIFFETSSLSSPQILLKRALFSVTADDLMAELSLVDARTGLRPEIGMIGFPSTQRFRVQ